MNTIANLIVRIATDLSDFRNGMNTVAGEMRSAGSAAMGAGATLTKGLSLPIIGAGVACIKTAADFEAGMSSIKAVSGATADEMKLLEAAAMKAGAETKYSAKEAASGMEELIKAGVSTKDILGGGLTGALNLAAAGEIELKDAAEIASTVLNAFRKDGLNVAQAADLLAGAANASATDVGELKYALSMVSAVASGVGANFKDTTTALAVFAQNGLKGSDAGTSLKTMLLNLTPSTKKAKEAFAELGLTAANGSSEFYDSAGNMKGLADVSGILQSKFKGMSAEARQLKFKELFGTDAIRAANILFTEGSAGFNKMQSDLSKVKAVDVAAERMNNFKGALEQFKGSMETLMIVVGKAFLPALTQIAQKAMVLVNSFLGMSNGQRKLIITVLGLVAAIGPLLMILGGMMTGLSGVISLIGFLVSPIGLVVAAVVALIAVFAYMVATNEGLRKKVLAIWNIISTTVGNAIKAIPGLWAKYGPMIVNGMKSGFEAIVNAGKSLYAGLIKIWNVIGPSIMQIAGNIKKWFDTNGPIIMAGLMKGLQIAQAVLVPIVSMFIESFKKIVPWIEPIKLKIMELGTKLMELFNTCKPIFEGIGAVVVIAMGIIVGVINGVISALGPFIDMCISVLNTVVDVVGLVVALLKGDWSEAWEYMKKIAVDVWNVIGGVFNTIYAFIDGFCQGIVTFFYNLWYAIVGGSIVPDLVNGVLSWFGNMVDGVKNFVGSLVNAVTGAFNTVKSTISGIVSSAWNWGSNMMGNLVGGIKSMAGGVKDAVLGVADSIKNFLGFGSPTKEGPGATADRWAPNLMNMMNKQMLASIPEIQTTLNSVFKQPTSYATPMSTPVATSPMSGATSQKLELSGKITIEGVNDQGQFIAAADYIASEINNNTDRFSKAPSVRRIFKC